MRTDQGSDPVREVDRDYWDSGDLRTKTVRKPGTGNNITEERYFNRQGEPAKIRRQREGQSDQGMSGSAADNPFRFQGFYLDSGVKTYDMQARQYRADAGRFLSGDKYESAGADLTLQADPLTQNRYAFPGGNPINEVEFDGHGTGGPGDRYNTTFDGTTWDREKGKAIAGPGKGNGSGNSGWRTPDYGGAGDGQPARRSKPARPALRRVAAGRLYTRNDFGGDAARLNKLVQAGKLRPKPKNWSTMDFGERSVHLSQASPAPRVTQTRACPDNRTATPRWSRH